MYFAGEDRERLNSWLARVTLAVIPAHAGIYLVHLIVLDTHLALVDEWESGTSPIGLDRAY